MRNVVLYMSMPLDGFADLVETTPFPSGVVAHVYRPHHT
jgi:hypothetical protein